MKRNPISRTIKCSHEGCKEAGYYTFDTHREYVDHCKRVQKWSCTRHLNPESVLSKDNFKTGELLTCKTLYKDGTRLGNFWQHANQAGTENCMSGFQGGNGYKAWADDFPEGTILKVISEIILP